MSVETFIDLEIVADAGSEYLVRINKEVLNSLAAFGGPLTLRHWDGEKPVVLEPYGETSVRTREDASEANNLEKLPKINMDDLIWEL